MIRTMEVEEMMRRILRVGYVYGHCGEYGKHNPHYYRFVYLDTDGEQLEEYLELKRNALFY